MGTSGKKYLYIVQIVFAVILYSFVQETMQHMTYFTLAILKGSSNTVIINVVKYIVNSGENEFVTLVALSLAGLICIPIYYKWYRYSIRFKKHIIIKEALSVKNVSLICVAGISTNLFIASMIELFEVTTYFNGYDESIKALTNGNIIISAILVVIIAPVCEELLNRGIVYEKIKMHLPVLPANIVQAAIFATMHGNLLQIIYAFILGLLLGYIYEKYKSIYAPIIVHLLFNATTKVNSVIFNEEIINNNTIMITVCIVSGLIFMFVLNQVKQSPTIEYIKEPGFQMFDLKELQSKSKFNV